MAHSLCVRQCGKNLTPSNSFDFLNCLSIDTVFVPHFTDEETEAQRGDVTSLKSQTVQVAIPAQVRAARAAPCFVCLLELLEPLPRF